MIATSIFFITRRPPMSALTAHERTLILSGTCNGETQQEICATIIRLNLISDEEIILYIDSDGGGMSAAIHIYDTIKESRARVRGIVIGRAVSAAFVTLLACHHRVAFSHANLMYHAPALVGMRLDQVDFEEQLALRKGFHDIMISELVRRGKASRAQFEQWSREEKYLSASQALEVGMIDEIMSS